jgi:NAD(P)H-dependent FMN reductase
MYSKDYEQEKGYSNSLVELKNDIQLSDGLLLSVNEHNSYPSAYTKNLLDWLSRLELKFLTDKKVLLMSTSGGKRGATGSREVIEKMLPRFGATITATFSQPTFHQNFDMEKGILDQVKAVEHREALETFLSKL